MKKNIKILLYECVNLESLSFSFKDKNNLSEILKTIEASMEKIKALRRMS